VRAVLPVILHRLIAMWACTSGDRFQGIDKVIARDGINHQSNQQYGNDPHEKHNLLLFMNQEYQAQLKNL
jgi:hypothetical protein